MSNKRSEASKIKMLKESNNFKDRIELLDTYSEYTVHNNYTHWKFNFSTGLVLNFYPTTHAWRIYGSSKGTISGQKGINSCIKTLVEECIWNEQPH